MRPEANHSRTDASTGDTLSSLPLSPSPCRCPCPSGHFHSLRGSHWLYLQNTARVWPALATPSHHSHLGAGKASSLVSDSSQGPLSVYSLPRARGVFFKKRIPLRRPLHPQCKLLAGPSTQPHPAHGSGQAAPRLLSSLLTYDPRTGRSLCPECSSPSVTHSLTLT